MIVDTQALARKVPIPSRPQRREQISQIKSSYSLFNIESSSDFSGELFYFPQGKEPLARLSCKCTV